MAPVTTDHILDYHLEVERFSEFMGIEFDEASFTGDGPLKSQEGCRRGFGAARDRGGVSNVHQRS